MLAPNSGSLQLLKGQDHHITQSFVLFLFTPMELYGALRKLDFSTYITKTGMSFVIPNASGFRRRTQWWCNSMEQTRNIFIITLHLQSFTKLWCIGKRNWITKSDFYVMRDRRLRTLSTESGLKVNWMNFCVFSFSGDGIFVLNHPFSLWYGSHRSRFLGSLELCHCLYILIKSMDGKDNNKTKK